VALCLHDAQRIPDGRPGDAQILGELPFGRQLPAWAEPSLHRPGQDQLGELESALDVGIGSWGSFGYFWSLWY
jgi:hypothetical protein